MSAPDAIRAVLFDMDGVLVDSFEMWLHAMNDAAAALGHPAIPREALEAAFGQGVEDDLRTFYPGCTRAALEAAYAAALPRHEHRMRPNPEAPAVRALLAARGLASAVVTNTQADAVPRLLAHAGLGDAFDVVLGIEPGRAGKPAPDLLLAACEALDVPPTAALMVGDSPYDEQAARAAGTRWLSYRLRSGEPLEQGLVRALGIH